MNDKYLIPKPQQDCCIYSAYTALLPCSRLCLCGAMQWQTNQSYMFAHLFKLFICTLDMVISFTHSSLEFKFPRSLSDIDIRHSSVVVVFLGVSHSVNIVECHCTRLQVYFNFSTQWVAACHQSWYVMYLYEFVYDQSFKFKPLAEQEHAEKEKEKAFPQADKLKQENEKLRWENEELRRENEELRRQLHKSTDDTLQFIYIHSVCTPHSPSCSTTVRKFQCAVVLSAYVAMSFLIFILFVHHLCCFYSQAVCTAHHTHTQYKYSPESNP